MCPEELVLFISTLAIAISKDKSSDEVNLLSVIFSQLGDTLATIATCRDRIDENHATDSTTCSNSPTCSEPPICSETPTCNDSIN